MGDTDKHSGTLGRVGIRNVKHRCKLFVREQFCNGLALASYVVPKLNYSPNVHWLFCLTLPNSGSTVLAKVLASSAHAVVLTNRAEGQWLVPSLSHLSCRWDPDHHVSMRKVRARWMLRALRYSRGRPAVVVEKSPANLVRYKDYLQAFDRMETRLIALTRDPYAVCASWHKRYRKDQISKTSSPKLRHIHTEEGYFHYLAEVWLERMNLIAEAATKVELVIRYEDFVREPQSIISQIQTMLPLLSDIDVDAQFAVKDYPVQSLRDMNQDQVSLLGPDQIAAISSGLMKNRTILERFGYSIMS